MRTRLNFCLFLCLTPVAAIAARLVFLQVVSHQRLALMAREQTDRELHDVPPRGRILDRFGRVLAESMPSWSCYLDPAMIRDPKTLAARLAPIVRLPASEIARKAAKQSRASGASQRGKRFVWLKHGLTMEQADVLTEHRIDGVGIHNEQQRYYPNGTLALAALGKVGQEGQGLSGLELQFDSVLAGKPGSFKVIRDGSGKAVFLRSEQDAGDGGDVVSTIDRNIQHYAESVLSDGVAKHHPQKAAIIVQDPKTGAVLAMASYPVDFLKNVGLQDSYEPGSTFKVVAMTAALDEGVVKESQTFDAENGRWEVAPRVFIKDHEPSGLLTAAQAMERSSNIAMAKIGLETGGDRFYRYARAFGFGAKTGIAFPGEATGLLKPASAMTRVTLANNSFGQGVSVTALQLTAAFSAIANGGLLMEPRLVLKAGSRSVAAASVRRVASAATISGIDAMLRGAVERGTGVSAAVKGFSVAGKTGTAQKIDPRTGHYSSTDYVASFVGYAPCEDPAFTILVMVDSPKNQYYGADVAAPLFSRLMRQILALRGVAAREPYLHSRSAGRAIENASSAAQPHETGRPHLGT